MPKAKSDLLTLREARRLQGPIVYGLCDQSGEVFYVGQTKAPASRFTSHRRIETMNATLAARLKAMGEDVRVRVLESSPADVNAAERKWIGRLSGQIVNIIGAAHWAWSVHSDCPWAGGSGNHAPSAFALRCATPEQVRLVRDRMATMSVEERCAFEVNLMSDLISWHGHSFAKWWSVAGPKIARVLGVDCPPYERMVATESI